MGIDVSVSCAMSILNLGRPIAEIHDVLILRRHETFDLATTNAVTKAEKWTKDAGRNCGINLDRSKTAIGRIKDAVERHDLPDAIRIYEEFKTAVYVEVGDWASGGLSSTDVGPRITVELVDRKTGFVTLRKFLSPREFAKFQKDYKKGRYRSDLDWRVAK